jgi:hypothetical protein
MYFGEGRIAMSQLQKRGEGHVTMVGKGMRSVMHTRNSGGKGQRSTGNVTRGGGRPGQSNTRKEETNG